MFSWPNTDCDSNETIMNQDSENWSTDQDQGSSHYQDYHIVGTPENDYSNHMVFTTGQPVQETEQLNHNLYFEANHDQYDSFLQHNSVQYFPLTPEPVTYQVFHLPSPNQNNNTMARKHQARISFVPTRTGTFKAIVKSKRKRTIFTRKQVETLEEIFKRKQYISREDKEIIANQLQLSDKAVKIWFQNRRLKDKKVLEQVEEDIYNIPSLDERSSPDIARLNYVESKINEKTDEFGYVTLDDGVMRDLFDVVDDFLTSRTNRVEATIGSVGSPIYEPISPASASDSNDEENASENEWKPSEPNESLQRLFDLQTMLSL